MFAIFLQGLFATLSDEYPKWQLESSRIGNNPGLSYRPALDVDTRGTVIAYRASWAKDVKRWVRAMNEFLEPYTNTSTPIKSKRVPCDFDKPPRLGEVCKFEIDPRFGDCADNSSFGYNTSAPCVYVKLNKIYGWVPEYYNNSADLHPDMPAELVNHIKGINNTLELNQIWLSCKGRRNDTVREIKFVGQKGFPGYYYPYMNLDGYQSPLIPIQIRLEPNQIEENNVVLIECRAWAKNIIYSGSLRERTGSVLIEIAIEK
jgi:sodium/potassium-transporting ATPase subunit beta